ncbi:hypothetical protein Taro_052562 [Colocasia esculenta]|uniref:Uncharacterized protein n=1 Tax=Colocasia esculenta TaxID=4460 RepID=A0A843XJQ6_COLES|nr:hypothetical protein [Colocasia esculenta]
MAGSSPSSSVDGDWGSDLPAPQPAEGQEPHTSLVFRHRYLHQKYHHMLEYPWPQLYHCQGWRAVAAVWSACRSRLLCDGDAEVAGCAEQRKRGSWRGGQCCAVEADRVKLYHLHIRRTMEIGLVI